MRGTVARRLRKKVYEKDDAVRNSDYSFVPVKVFKVFLMDKLGKAVKSISNTKTQKRLHKKHKELKAYRNTCYQICCDGKRQKYLQLKKEYVNGKR